MSDYELVIKPRVFLSQRNNPIERVGACILGGRYLLLASARIHILTAEVAGIPLVFGCTTPNKGQLLLATVVAMHMVGADTIYTLGDVEAVAAMAVGTETINLRLTSSPAWEMHSRQKRNSSCSARSASTSVLGPRRVSMVQDEHTDPLTVAMDLPPQPEHGIGMPSIAINPSGKLARESTEIVDQMLQNVPTVKEARLAVVDDMRLHWRTTSPPSLSRSSHDIYAKLWSRRSAIAPFSRAKGFVYCTATS